MSFLVLRPRQWEAVVQTPPLAMLMVSMAQLAFYDNRAFLDG